MSGSTPQAPKANRSHGADGHGRGGARADQDVSTVDGCPRRRSRRAGRPQRESHGRTPTERSAPCDRFAFPAGRPPHRHGPPRAALPVRPGFAPATGRPARLAVRAPVVPPPGRPETGFEAEP
ncbi:OsmC family peroxiredoxin [Streptomyces sp. NPDC101225]|uniref:OsmC family peroxiredoxin n=1 Tax=Streptomyces sp. NPDC101225 TaxID=3366135 RepID=UPI0038032980